jgi:hypothetical protein
LGLAYTMVATSLSTYRSYDNLLQVLFPAEELIV